MAVWRQPLYEGVQGSPSLSKCGTLEAPSGERGDAARKAFGGLDVVVASAGLGFFGPVGNVEDQEWQRTLDVNVTGAFRLVRAALPSLIERGGGSIVLVSSTAALVSGSENAAYVTSKTAMGPCSCR